MFDKNIRLDLNKYKKYKNDSEVLELREKIKSTFNSLIFIPESHEYFLDGIKLECVSNITHNFTEGFDAEAKSLECFKKYYKNPTSRYYKKTQQDILNEWKKISDDACDRGSILHEFGESCFWLMLDEPENISPICLDKFIDGTLIPTSIEEAQIIKFWNDLPNNYIPILSENRLFSKIYQYSGTFDMLFAFKDGNVPIEKQLLIFDYKTNVDLYKNFQGQCLLHPFTNMLDMPLSLYTLQLSLYQIPLEDIGLEIIGRRLIWIKDGEIYQKISLEDVTKKLREALSRELS